MKMENMTQIPPSLINRRWTTIASLIDSPLPPFNVRQEEADIFTQASLRHIFHAISEVAGKNPQNLSFARKELQSLFDKIQEMNQSEVLCHVVVPSSQIRDPPRRSSRTNEQCQSTSKRRSRNRCSYCGIEGHKITTCP